MTLATLPPVRRAVPLSRGDQATRLSMEQFFGNRPITLYSSGTAALARALAKCAARSAVGSPEAIVPAYGCPDLVAACVHAGVCPRLVDIAPAQWAYDTRSFDSALSRNTVAAVAVNLFGIGDGAGQLIPICKERGIALIQDSAQHLPREAIDWPGDYVILSFGRGKPLNLLGGGALIAPQAESQMPPTLPCAYTRRDWLRSTRAAAIAFNLFTRPHIYRIISALPGTSIGEVNYTPLGDPAPLPEHAWRRVSKAFELYRRQPSYRRDIWAQALQEWADCGITPLRSPGTALPSEPLRLCLLAPDRATRESLVYRLNQAGLGASRLYGAALPSVAGIPESVKEQGPFPNAATLAERLFTLPTHTLVTPNRISVARAVVLKVRGHR